MIEPSLWVHYLPTNILLLSFDLRYEWKDVFWTGINYATNQTIGLQFGYIIESDDRDRDKKIKVGVQAAYNLGGFGNIQGISYQAIAAYEFGAK